MKSPSTVLTAVVVALSTVIPSLALAKAVLFTPIVVNDSSFVCRVINVDKKPMAMEVFSRDGTGVQLETSGVVTVAPLQSIFSASGGAPTGAKFCQFNVSGSAKKVRGAALVDTATGTGIIVPAY